MKKNSSSRTPDYGSLVFYPWFLCISLWSPCLSGELVFGLRLCRPAVSEKQHRELLLSWQECWRTT